MGTLGAPEIIILVVVIALVFGWKKLPDAARSLGRSMRILKSEVGEMKNDGKTSDADTADGSAEAAQKELPTANQTANQAFIDADGHSAGANKQPHTK